jgi:hypothetical protein
MFGVKRLLGLSDEGYRDYSNGASAPVSVRTHDQHDGGLRFR